MKTLCMYSTVRFMPFAETQEFANVGVVVCLPQQGKLLFKLARKKFPRVTQFFDDIDGKLYAEALKMIEAELMRVQTYAMEHPGKSTVAIFKELTRFREGVIYFGNMGTALVNAPEEKLERLYEHYVQRSFATREYREAILEKNIRRTFKTRGIVGFKQQALKTRLGEFKLPFVEQTKDITRVIKPLAFDRKTPLAAFEHVKQWGDRLARLQNEAIVTSENMLVTMEPPTPPDFMTAYEDATTMLKEENITWINVADDEALVAFARQH
ncbi:DUF3037 domain-containing protein [Pseudidiomarina sediminum]|uniref:DUF3037 domain-containing protein n=1 Tax=Pseudidiomarina sediminum TaxID=431675 RepID=A0A432Z9C1_9GAMM|nr:DUF3037 domain-containing protein [Pseudidiomarina sediminum]RUO74519.1 DUF3037 domain-containing protein [Pseudidiomarina sediminum]